MVKIKPIVYPGAIPVDSKPPTLGKLICRYCGEEVHEFWDAAGSSMNPVWVPSQRMPFHIQCFHLWVLQTLDRLTSQVSKIEMALRTHGALDPNTAEGRKARKNLAETDDLDEYTGL